MENAIEIYERLGERTTQPFAIEILNELEIIEDRELIDLGCGTGGLAVEASKRGARVLAVDNNPDMVERTQQRLQPFEHSRAQFMDFNKLSLDDGTMDIAVSNFGALAYPRWEQALIEMCRVMKPGGRAALVMWTHERDSSPAHLMRRVFKDLFPDRDLWPDGFFPILEPRGLDAACRGAGLVDCDVRVVHSSWSPISSQNVVAESRPLFQSFPGYAALSDDERDTLHAALSKAFQRYSNLDSIIEIPLEAYQVHANKRQ